VQAAAGDRPQPGSTALREIRVRGDDTHARITLLRHAEPDWTPEGASVADPGLTPYGRAQARAAAERIARGGGVDAIYVSPYRRAQETAAPLTLATGRTPVTLPGLAEIGVAVDGLSQEDVDRYFVAATQRPLSEHWDGWPGAESFRSFHDRVTAALEELLARHAMRPRRETEHDFTQWDQGGPPPRLVVVAHGGTNSVALAHLLDVRPVPWEWLRFESELAAFSVVQARPLGPRGHVWSLQNFGEVDHLVQAGLRER
jgi:2,3-bisphosphoglycerate-dependent phosphoglycerate mutase